MPTKDQPASAVIPGPKGSPLAWGQAMAKDALGYMLSLQKQYGDIVKVPWLFPTFQITDPDLVGKILLGTEKTNQKSFVYKRLSPLLGHGLVTSNGEFWKKQRRLSNAAFHAKVLAALVPMMQSEADKMVQSWKLRSGEERTIDISAEMMKLTFQIIVRALFSTDLSEKSKIISDALHEMQEYANYLFYALAPIPLMIPTAKNRRAKSALRRMDAVVYDLINEHRRQPEAYHDLLSIYLSARDEETGAGMSDRQLRDEVTTLMLAGHDTTATTLSMCFELLSRHPEAQAKVADELHTLPSGPWQAEDLKGLNYTAMVFAEALRLFPATWGIGRELTEDLSYKNFNFPKGATMLLSQYLTHRHPAYWEEPEAFKPERFAPDAPRKHHPFAYFPFGGGQRSCIGSQLSRLEAQVIMASILKHFEVLPVAGAAVKMLPRITLIFVGGVPLSFKAK